MGEVGVPPVKQGIREVWRGKERKHELSLGQAAIEMSVDTQVEM